MTDPVRESAFDQLETASPGPLHRQVIRASLVTRPSPAGRPGQHTVRMTFQQQVYNNQGMIRLSQTLNQGELYTEFYHRLAQSVALEALLP